ncbi:uracil-xanthine permease family protein [Faecalitalea cylindroides]|uniref:uracil-xanthine permease family protein n=1 Tax=Faecalitalea cylindroides TaxID=39483 RepID=UPI0022E573F1|nr:nucleobase:cation symporter-2 family protein [Faecalitalea cylindroides]
MKTKNEKASVFELNGIPSLKEAFPLALQHVVAMIVGCVTPAIIISQVAGLGIHDQVIFVQAALVIAGISTLIQLFPIGRKIGSGLPVIMGVSFAYLPSMQAIAGTYDIATILGAQLIGGIAAILVGIFIKKLRKLFPPIVTGTVVFTIGLSLYPTAVNYMAGGASSANYGSWQNWLIAFIVLAIVTGLNHFAKGIWKLSSILIGIIAGYIIAACFGMIDFSSVTQASMFQVPQFMHFGMKFEFSAILTFVILFTINSIQAIGDFSATTTGGLDRQPTDDELQGGIVAYGITNILGSFFGGLPTATFSQNVGIVATTKVVNRCVLGLAACIILIAGFVPVISALLTTIPQCVLGGATISVFASIAMTGMKLIASQPLDYRNTSIVGLGVALGMGITQASASLETFPLWVTTVFGKSPVVLATITAIILNLILPKPKDK